VVELTLTLGDRRTAVVIHTLIVAGWTGRDRAAVEAHIAELAAVGVQRPSSVPVFYRVSASRLTTSTSIEATPASSGEVEALLLRESGRLWVGVGSDHTDRKVETYDVAVSKQMCDKPIAPALWPYEDVADHWDRLTLRSWIDDDVLYQHGTLDGLMHPDDLCSLSEPAMDDGTLMFCGTFPAVGGVRPAAGFRYELEDPLMARRIRSGYETRPLPIVR
jgi:hypothetical protein